MVGGTGTYEELHDDGQLAVSGELRAGAREGDWRRFGADGAPTRTVTYTREQLGTRPEPWMLAE